MVGKNSLVIPEFLSRMDYSLSFANTVASQMAIEKAFGIQVSKQTQVIRELLLKFEIIHSHLTYIYRKIMPKTHGIWDYLDYLKKHDKDHEKATETILKVEKILQIIGKRYPHPINSTIGGHFETFSDDEKKEIIQISKDILSQIIKTGDALQKKQNYSTDIIDSYLSLWSIDSTPLIYAKIRKDDGSTLESNEKYQNFDSEKSFFVGPISRLNNGSKLLSSTAEKLMKKHNIKFPITNPYLTPLAMIIESVHLTERAIEVLQNTHFENETRPIFQASKSIGFAAVESAKGTIYHNYEIDGKGMIAKAKIILPQEQNERFLQKAMRNLPFDSDKKTKKQLMEEIDYLVDMFYL